jgi:hypothetical protein
MTAVATKLREARALIERGWTQEAFARGKSGRVVVPNGRAAVCFCAVGAIKRYDHWCYDLVAKPLATAIGVKGVTGIYDWNDAPERTQADVLAAFDRAIELAEQEAR